MARRSRPSILVIAYVCSPKMGTEPGAGWGVLMALMEFADITVITGSRYIDEVREWEREHSGASGRFVEVSDRIVGPKFRWHRVPEFIYYLTWLRRAKKTSQRLIERGDYDVAMHVTFSAFWLPTPAVRLGIPSVWGPVGGAVTTPKPLRKLLGFAGMIQEVLDYASVRLMAAVPATRRTALAATERLLQNEETRAMLPPAARPRSRILNHALFSVIPEFPAVKDGRYVLWVSPMESRKGPRLAIEAIARTSEDVKLKMVGDGPQRKHLEQAAADLGISHRVTFTGRVPREEAVQMMRGATTVLFTGLREEGGLALAEAMYAARRIIVVDHGGAGSIARSATDPSRVALVPPAEVATTASRLAAAIEAHMAAAPVADQPLVARDKAVAELASAVAAAQNS